MKKNGFTLIEILVVIVLLAAVSVTVGVSMQGSQDRQTEKEIKNYEETIEKAACVYAEKYDIEQNSEVTIETLISEGLLKKNLKNPKTEIELEDETVDKDGNKKAVSIKWVNNEKICEFSLKD